MTDKEHFDFWYAVNSTQVISLPTGRLETFGTTVVNYHLLAELMDEPNKVRIREGRVEASRPQIITPQHFEEIMLEGFGESEASQYADWLAHNAKDLMLLKYGFAIKKVSTNDHIVSETLPIVIDQVTTQLKENPDPLGALIVGVEEPWEVCLIKLMTEVVQQSAPQNAQDLRRDPTGARQEIEQMFNAVQQRRVPVAQLSALLEKHNMFDEYQDRFFALVR